MWEGDCPHCGGRFVVARADVRCGVFRHGAIKHSGEPMNPHASERECDDLLARGLIHGCGGPFRVNAATGEVTKCGFE